MKLKKLISAASISSILTFGAVSVAFAQGANCAADETSTDFGCLPSDPVAFTSTIYTWGLGLLAFVAVLFMIIGGYNIMMSRGNFEQLERGKSYIFYSIAGLLLAIFGFVFIEIVSSDILRIPGFS